MSILIKKCTVEEIENTPNFFSLVDEYADEVKVAGAPSISIKKELYRTLERAGVFQFFGAYINDSLVGFITVLCTVLPHYGVIMAVSESFFVAKQHRRTGAGTKLRYAAENHARDVGAPCILISAPTGGVLEKALSCLHEYKETNRVFFRSLANA